MIESLEPKKTISNVHKKNLKKINDYIYKSKNPYFWLHRKNAKDA
jgi:hypothetical protein